MTFCYPLQFVIYGEPWLDCVLLEYPYQIPGLVNYIYIPTIFSVSLIFFGLTLLLRHQISPRTFAIFFRIEFGCVVYDSLDAGSSYYGGVFIRHRYSEIEISNDVTINKERNWMEIK